ncbi:hypothetical protein CSOJ01_15257 [Colletotrichum sojae]|uniref:Uncharacterized protein n=1 Tax=Colletotrichum sojae TaxID=2175907 RepID=A0A8H6MID4_9PEZI|nr:hypothetical protein CSOJ01_15257 [Colletotrichum sojae]
MRSNNARSSRSSVPTIQRRASEVSRFGRTLDIYGLNVDGRIFSAMWEGILGKSQGFIRASFMRRGLGSLCWRPAARLRAQQPSVNQTLGASGTSKLRLRKKTGASPTPPFA